VSEPANLADSLTAWAASEPSVKGLILIGSKARPVNDTVWAADAQSDWDFQIISSQPQTFLDPGWAKSLGGLQMVAYASRTARIGGVPKINAVFQNTEADFVVLPAGILFLLKCLVRSGLHRRSEAVRRRLQDLALIIRPGWKFLKGASAWEPFYLNAVLEVPDPRLNDDDLRRLADGFVCDYVSIGRKINRGELIAAQRLMHRDLAETNFRLLHELRLRRGDRSFPEARRIELVASCHELEKVTVNALVEPTQLRAAVQRAAATCRALLRDLVGENWQWPPLIP
jgi:hypothetical protein